MYFNQAVISIQFNTVSSPYHVKILLIRNNDHGHISYDSTYCQNRISSEVYYSPGFRMVADHFAKRIASSGSAFGDRKNEYLAGNRHAVKFVVLICDQTVKLIYTAIEGHRLTGNHRLSLDSAFGYPPTL